MNIKSSFSCLFLVVIILFGCDKASELDDTTSAPLKKVSLDVKGLNIGSGVTLGFNNGEKQAFHHVREDGMHEVNVLDFNSDSLPIVVQHPENQKCEIQPKAPLLLENTTEEEMSQETVHAFQVSCQAKLKTLSGSLQGLDKNKRVSVEFENTEDSSKSFILSLTENGDIDFKGKGQIPHGAKYNVKVKSQPNNQLCTRVFGSSLGSDFISIECVKLPNNLF